MMGGLDSACLELSPSFSRNAFVAEISESFVRHLPDIWHLVC